MKDLLGKQFEAKKRIAARGDRSRPAKRTVDAVYDQLTEDYPASALTWVHSIEWSGPKNFPLSKIDFAGDDDFEVAASQPEKVNGFRKRIRAAKKKGEHIKPAIIISGPKKAKAPDGHHRVLAYAEENEPVYAWVGTTSRRRGPWDTLHDHQFKPDTGPQRVGDKSENVYR